MLKRALYLAGFRANFTADAVTTELFTVAGAPADTRVRLVAMTAYDGEAFRATGAGDYSPLPWTVSGVDPKNTATVTIAHGYASHWLPLVGSLSSITFEGSGAYARAGQFAYNRATLSGYTTAEAASGQSYRISYGDGQSELTDPDELGHARAGSDETVTEEGFPELAAWVKSEENAGRTTLSQLASRIIQRSYLSHSRDDPGATPDSGIPVAEAGWKRSDAGHSRSRIEQMFADMNDTQQFPDCSNEARDAPKPEAKCAATTGDQEQYATAIALVARYLGYDSRVVLGATAPEDGVVRGQDMTAWAEVSSDGQQWFAIDATPRADNRFNDAQQDQSFKQYQTEVPPDTVRNEPDPEAQPDAAQSPESSQDDARNTLASVWAVIRAVLPWLLLALAVSAPFLVILLAKVLRRRARRREAPVERVASGWDEYIDSVVDYGYPPPSTQTRRELAAEYRTTHGQQLAELADAAVFSETPPTGEQADGYWQLIDAQRSELKAASGWWRRVAAALSLKSFTRYLGGTPAHDRSMKPGRMRRPGVEGKRE